MGLIDRVFGWEQFEVAKILKFSDESVQAVFDSAAVKVSEINSVDTLLTKAQDARGSSAREDRVAAASIYLHFAQGDARPTTLTRAECFHRAANELRGLDLLERAAECYFHSAVRALDDVSKSREEHTKRTKADDEAIALGLRSAGRAGAQYAAIGVDDKADEAHRLKQELLRRKHVLKRNWLPRFLLLIWKASTGYGTSANQWFATLLLVLAAFALLYGLCLSFGAIELANDACATPIVTPIYLAVVNLVSFGAYTQIVPRLWLAEVVLIAQAATSFVVVGTGVTFLTSR